MSLEKRSFIQRFKRLFVDDHSENHSKQAGNGISRRHILGSKIAKRLQSILLQYLKNPKDGTNWRARKRGPLRFFNIYSVAKYQKIDGEPFRDIMRWIMDTFSKDHAVHFLFERQILKKSKFENYRTGSLDSLYISKHPFKVILRRNLKRNSKLFIRNS